MPAIRFGVIRAFDSVTWEADVEVRGYLVSYLTGVPVAFHLREDLIAAGASCLVVFDDEFNATDGVVVALFGGRPADDPQFDPVYGHDHSGNLRRGPRLKPATALE